MSLFAIFMQVGDGVGGDNVDSQMPESFLPSCVPPADTLQSYSRHCMLYFKGHPGHQN